MLQPEPTSATARNGKYDTSELLIQMTTRVGSGSSAPRPANSCAKVGMTFQRMTLTTSAAITMTATGYISRDSYVVDRIDHPRLPLAGQLARLLHVVREPLQNRVENTARLTRGHHVGEQRIEGFRVLAHRVGERQAGLDIGPRLQNGGREVL